MRLSGTYISDFELSILSNRTKISINIIREDQRYQNKGEVIRLSEGEVDINLYYREGDSGGKGNNGHYSGVIMDKEKVEELSIRISKFLGWDMKSSLENSILEINNSKNKTFNNNDTNNNSNQMMIDPIVRNEVKLIIMGLNIRSIREHIKKGYLTMDDENE